MGLALSSAGCQLEPLIPIDDIFLRPTAEIVGSPADFGFEYESLFLPIGETRGISAWHVKAADPKGIVVIIPGSDKNKSRYLIGLPVFIPHGYDVILMDYEGFGESPGEHTLANLIDNGFAAIEYAQSKHPTVIAFGVSTGAPTAIKAAVDKDLAAVLLEAPLILADEPELYLSNIMGIELAFLWNIANAYVHPQIPPGFDILTNAALADEPKLIMCSVDDDVVTFESGLRVFEAAAEPKEFWEMQGDHGGMIMLDFAAYQNRIISWLDATLGKTPRYSTK
jgi:alpha-beta hydrolase superfamily lysophospholipase